MIILPRKNTSQLPIVDAFTKQAAALALKTTAKHSHFYFYTDIKQLVKIHGLRLVTLFYLFIYLLIQFIFQRYLKRTTIDSKIGGKKGFVGGVEEERVI